VRDLLQLEWFVWGIGLILSFQILVVVLGELLYRADRRELPVAPILRAARNTLLPLLVIYVFVVKVLGEPDDAIAVRAIATALWISVLPSIACSSIFSRLVGPYQSTTAWTRLERSA